MKRIISKLNTFIIMSALLAGIFCFACGFTVLKNVPKGVVLNGVEVGGLSRSAAAEKVRDVITRELSEKTLEIRGERAVYKFNYPEINFRDNIYYLLKNCRKGENLTAEISYYLCGADIVAAAICADESTEKIEPSAEFRAQGEPFAYSEGRDGVEADRARLLSDVDKSLNGAFEPVYLYFNKIFREQTLQDVKRKTALIASFTTKFDDSNLNRSSNIRLAAARLNGREIKSGQSLSFNGTVGPRVKERGFLSAKIIENGEFVDGVGGGVCQVSTTLYNAALLSGLKITEYHPHTLSVGYVPPSRDAMVSGSSCDLKILNNRNTPVYIRAQVSGGSITFRIYGENDGSEYSVISTVTGALPAPEEHTDDPSQAREGKDGIISESYIVVQKNGKTERKFLRRDKYKAVKRVIYDAPQSEESGDGTDGNIIPENPT